ncbi:MAG: hypothetical protein WEA81_08305, partial [Dehalococcoidia bacterium]
MPPLLRWAPWALLCVFAALMTVVGVLALRGTILSDTLGTLIVMTSFAIVGAVLAARRPGNGIGWICLGLALLGGSRHAAHTYATHGLITEPGSLPGAHLAAWWIGWTSTPSVVILLMLLPLLFPTGRPPSPRWRPLLWLVLATMVVGTLSSAFSPGPIQGAPEFANPLAVEIPVEIPASIGGSLFLTFIGIFMAAAVLSTASVVARYRHARGPERQQLKWFLFAFLLVIANLIVGSAAGAVLSGGDPTVTAESPLLDVWWSLVFPATAMLVPIAIGIAVLRYRLYDIDLIINRTLVYGALTATLAAAYVGTIAVLQVALQPITQSSQLAVAASTLA